MPRRQPFPRLWLMTDERIGDALWGAMARLPRGGGVIFRHYATPPAERRALYERVRRIARARRLVLLLAGGTRQAIAWRADGVHGSMHHRAARPLLRTAPAHDRAALIAATRVGANLALLSPVFVTRSHPGTKTLGPVRFGLITRGISIPVIALGGMDARRGRRLRAYGWAAIDAWTGDQKRKVVPT